jgi:SAM-dependent methyltransferase
MDDEHDCCFDDWVGYWSKKTRRRPTAAKVTVSLLGALEDAGIRGRTILDIGCGIGDLTSIALQRGAERGHGIELSPKAVREARRLAVERGVADRLTFEIGDGARVELPRADVVVLNRVFCCYPDIEGLLERSVAAANDLYAFTAPPSSGVGGAIAKAETAWSNRWYRLRDRKFRGFRVFVHDLDRVDARLRDAGFRRIRDERARLLWQLRVYTRGDRVAAAA